MDRKSISHVLMKINDVPKIDIVEALRSNNHESIKLIYQTVFHPNVVWVLPQGVPPYAPSPINEPGRLYAEARRLYIFLKRGNDGLRPPRREQLFVQLLESVNSDDALLLLAIKDGKWPHKNITKQRIEEAFPGIFN